MHPIMNQNLTIKKKSAYGQAEITVSQRRRPASTIAAAHPRVAPFKKESRALSRFRDTPARPCLNFFPQCTKSIASRNGASAILHDRQTMVAAHKLGHENAPEILNRMSSGSKAKFTPKLGFTGGEVSTRCDEVDPKSGFLGNNT